jgi:hypothetical protein
VKVERIFNVLLVLALLLSVGVQLSQAQVRGPEGKTELQANAPAATVASRISYQGVLKESGSPVTGSRDMTFNFYTTTDCSGAALQTVAKAGVQVTNGVFSPSLDVTATNFNGQALYVQVVIGGTNIGCQEILPVPYALSLRPSAHIGGSGAGDGNLYLHDSSGATIFELHSGVGSLYVGGTGESGEIYIKDSTNTSTITLNAGSGSLTVGTTGQAGVLAIRNDAGTQTFGVDGSSGKVSQTLTGNGLVKAGVYVQSCGDGTPAILRSFNNVNATAIAVTAGSSAGRCTIDFGFDVSDRYIVATAYGTAIARFVTFAPGADNEKWNFYRYDENGTGQTGNIMVLIY